MDKRNLEELLSNRKFDPREAAYLVAQNNPDAVAKKLEEMGVGYKL